MLAMIMIRNKIIKEKDLNTPIQLDELSLMQLPSEVQERLKHVTLHQVMTHQAGLGDYLDIYLKRIESGSIPDIKNVDDFLKFVDSKTFPIKDVFSLTNRMILMMIEKIHF